MKKELILLTSITLGLLTGCGGSSSESDAPIDNGDQGQVGSGDQGGDKAALCADEVRTVQWEKLLTEQAPNLSDYQLFSSQCNPTTAPSERGLAYDLSVPLFTDYATKYRFVFVPENSKATYISGIDTQTESGQTMYVDDGTLDYPVGTVITKTFSLPSNTGERGFENENMIETRLLVRRATGWLALPYVWNADKTDAVLDFNGELYSDSQLTHNGSELTFDYAVPDPQKCQRCHQVDGKTEPLGPKVRYLNMDYSYDDGVENQLTRWVSEGLLDGATLPAQPESVLIFNDSKNLDDIQAADLEDFAKSWLDINCAHCHNPAGDASNTNMQVEFTRSFAEKNAHGVCQKPISFGGEGLEYIIKPGNAAESIMVFRMNTRDGGDRMPPLGRDLIHDEGVALVSKWINSLEGSCN